MLVKWFNKVLAGKAVFSFLVLHGGGKDSLRLSPDPTTHVHLCTYAYTLNKCNYTK